MRAAELELHIIQINLKNILSEKIYTMTNTGYHLCKVNTHKAIHTCFPCTYILGQWLLLVKKGQEWDEGHSLTGSVRFSFFK